MNRFLPRSLAGQMVLLLGLALFVAQLANFALILNERQKLTLARNQGPAITRFAGVAADVAQAAPEFRDAVVSDQSRRGARFAIAETQAIGDAERDAALETRLTTALADAGVAASEVRATTAAARERPQGNRQYLRVAVRLGTDYWLTGRLPAPRRDPYLAVRLGAATLLLFLIVLGATIWIAVRLARPLRDLTLATEKFEGRAAFSPVPSRGPADLRRAIDAFNAMNDRVIALLDEKDRMLGAIGHDLRTPLASLRIRVETMEPDVEREAAIAKINEMTAMLDDILMLARTGRAREEGRPTDLAALAEAVANDAHEAGHDVVFVDSGPCVATVHPPSITRALRNLVDNAVKYAGSATIEARCRDSAYELRVVDNGPGLSNTEIATVLQPFVRLEPSRNRSTGGTGLGLPIAESIAKAHGGRLILRRNDPNGLAAIIELSKAVPDAR